MNPIEAGQICGDLDRVLRGAEMNLGSVALLIQAVIREQAWRERKIRTGEVVKCSSFLELLTAPPLKGFGEDPKKVESLLKDDVEALRLFREAIVMPNGVHRPKEESDASNNITSTDMKRGTSKSYTLNRLHRKAPELYKKVVAGKMSANKAAIEAGFRKVKTPLEQARFWFGKLTKEERRAFLASLEEV